MIDDCLCGFILKVFLTDSEGLGQGRHVEADTFDIITKGFVASLSTELRIR